MPRLFLFVVRVFNKKRVSVPLQLVKCNLRAIATVNSKNVKTRFRQLFKMSRASIQKRNLHSVCSSNKTCGIMGKNRARIVYK